MRKRGRPRYPDILTPREWEVLNLIEQGLTNEQIARRLGISFDGAKFHVAQILGKLGVASRHEAAAVAHQNRGSLLRRFAMAPLAWRVGLGKTGTLVAGAGVAAGVAVVLALIFFVLVKAPVTPVFDMYPGLYVLDLDSGRVERKADLRGVSVDGYVWSQSGGEFRLSTRAEPNDNLLLMQTIDAVTGAVVDEERRERPDSLADAPNLIVSPNGRLVAEFVDGNLEIRDAVSGEPKSSIATSRQFSLALAWSPDSRWVAFLNGPHDDAEPSRLIIAAADGSSPPRVLSPGVTPADFWNSPGSWIDWSADSREIAFVRDGELWTVDVASGVVRLRLSAGLPVITEPRWSPDGRRIAFRSAGVTAGVYVAASDGSESRYVASAGTATLSPDGERIAFEYGGKLFTIGTDGRGVVAVATLETEALVMTDYFYSHFCPVLFPPHAGPAWSPDGKYVIGQPFGDPADIVIAPADGSKPARVLAKGFAPSWSPDGTHFAYVRDCEVHISLISGRALGPETGVSSGFSYSWRPDGNLLVQSQREDPKVIDRSGKVIATYARNLIPSPAGGFELRAESFRTPGTEEGSSSPDSRLTLLDASSKVLRTIEHGVDANFSPDGRYLVYGVRPPFQPDETVSILDLHFPASDAVRLTVIRDMDDQVWSPDGRKMAFVQRNEDGSRQLMVLDTKSLDITKVADNAADPQWFPDSKRLLYTGR